MVLVSESYKRLDFTNDNMINDYYASMLLGHKTIDDQTILATQDDLKLILCGTLTVITPSGKTLTGSDVFSLLKKDKYKDSDLEKWLKGKNVKKFDDYQITSNPWFEIIDFDGDHVAEFSVLTNNQISLFDV